MRHCLWRGHDNLNRNLDQDNFAGASAEIPQTEKRMCPPWTDGGSAHICGLTADRKAHLEKFSRWGEHASHRQRRYYSQISQMNALLLSSVYSVFIEICVICEICG